jgi:hypothetical protein
VRAAASVLAVVHDAPTSNPDSPERRPAAPVDVVGAPRLRNPTKTRRTKKRLGAGIFFVNRFCSREKRARVLMFRAPTRVVDVRLFAWYYKAPKRKSQS